MTKALRENYDNLKSKAVNKKIIKTRPLSTVMVIEELNTVLAIPVEINEMTYLVRTDIPQNVQNLPFLGTHSKKVKLFDRLYTK